MGRWSGGVAEVTLSLALLACGRGNGAYAAPGATDRMMPSAPVVARAGPAHDLRASPAEVVDASPVPRTFRAPDVDAGPADPEDMLLVPGGVFTMGADRGGQEDEHPAHAVALASFWLDRTEVTNAAWDTCVSSGVCRGKSDAVRTAHPDFNGPNQPVSGVSWDDAHRYCAWRGKRMPREAEYERAVRGADDRRYPWGNDEPTVLRTVFRQSRPDDVGTHAAGRGPYGHDDLAGNVWEWMEDAYDPYAYRRPDAGRGTPGTCEEILRTQDELRNASKQGFTGSNPIPDECEHSIRGGAYNYDADGLRSTNRVHHPGWYRIPMLGVRCAKDATTTAPSSDKR